MSEPGGAQAPAIEFRGVRKRFGEVEVIGGVSLSIPRGQVVVVCGPSGSGKSTLVRLVNRLDTLSEGEILIDGVPTAAFAGRQLQKLREGIGFVFQHFNLYGHLTARENITLAPRKLLGLSAAAANARADELLARVGLSGKAELKPAQLSGGQQQRVAIARALAMQPAILLFDEPTSALDPEMIGEVLGVMREIARSGTTMLVVTHEMGFAREIADRVLFIDGGRVLADAPPALFFNNPPHARIRRFLAQLLSPIHNREEEQADA
ncbi:amino acid ABC transporter ATP-binding protein [Xanthobacter sediminis]|uniref:amino acid ABC transporter ATP-binding protein n=1 Tax=Xanthobacter sediminis TaxID=3119926 RepID=UPI00372C8BC6